MQLNCALPDIDMDVITLGHGSGGVLTSRLLDQVILAEFSNDLLDQRHDGAIFELQGKLAFSTDSYVVSPIEFPGGNIGDLAINGTVNDIAMCGAMAQYLSLSFIIEEGLSMEVFKKIVKSISKAANLANVKIVTGDTKVVEKGKGDQLFINTSGVGIVHPKSNINSNRITDGDAIIVSHSIAHHGMAIMSVREGLKFESSIVSDSRPLNDICNILIDTFEDKIKLLRDPTRGGVATILNELAEDTKLGIQIYEQQINIDEQILGACEMLGLDPLFVANEGVFIAIVDAKIADDVLTTLHQYPTTNRAFNIGFVTKNHPKKVVMESIMGGNRYITKLIGDQLPRIC